MSAYAVRIHGKAEPAYDWRPGLPGLLHSQVREHYFTEPPNIGGTPITVSSQRGKHAQCRSLQYPCAPRATTRPYGTASGSERRLGKKITRPLKVFVEILISAAAEGWCTPARRVAAWPLLRHSRRCSAKSGNSRNGRSTPMSESISAASSWTR